MKWLVTLGASLHAVVTILMTSSLAGGRLLEKRNKATRPSNRSIEQSQRTKRNRRCAACICGTAGSGCSSEHQDFQNRTSEQIRWPARQDCETGSDPLPDRTTDH